MYSRSFLSGSWISGTYAGSFISAQYGYQDNHQINYKSKALLDSSVSENERFIPRDPWAVIALNLQVMQS